MWFGLGLVNEITRTGNYGLASVEMLVNFPFGNGRRFCRATRLPARLRLSASEVQIEQIGSALWVHPRTAPACDMGAWLQQFDASTEPLPDDFLLDRRDNPPQQRDWV